MFGVEYWAALAYFLLMNRLVCFFFLIVCLFTQAASAQKELEPLRLALEKQAQYQSIKASIKQTKTIPALSEPIVSSGELWFKPGKAFRWQLGNPLSSTAIYHGDLVYLLDEERMLGDSYPTSDRKVKPLLLMFGMGDGANLDSLTKAFKYTGVGLEGDHYVASFIPRSIRARRVLKSLVIQVNLKTSCLERVHWTQKDGTSVTTTFNQIKINEELPKDVFSFDKSLYRWK